MLYEKLIVYNMPTFYGNTILKGEELNEPTIVYGNFSAEQVKVTNTLKIVGRAELHCCQIKMIASITGYLSVNKSSFQDFVTIIGDRVDFDSSNSESIVFKKTKSGSHQIFRVKGASKINSLICFEIGEGLIEIGPEVILPDRILGAKVRNVG